MIVASIFYVTAEEEHSFITIVVNEYDVGLDGGINTDILGYRSGLTDREAPIYYFGSSVKLGGLCSYPEDRANHYYEVQLLCSPALSDRLSQKVKDLHKVDKSDMPIYRKYKNMSVPVYEKPFGLALVEKVRGKDAWSIWMQVDRQTISDALVIMN